MRLVVIESPYAADSEDGVTRNVAYARACLADSLRRGEAPFASHLLYAQPGVLDDRDPEQRRIGILAGLWWGDRADLRVVYVDLGVSNGMRLGINQAAEAEQPIEYRRLGGEWS